MNSESAPQNSADDRYWRQFLTTGANEFEKRGRRWFAHLPDNPRCKACNAPFEGLGAPLMRVLLGKRQGTRDPRYCNQCEGFMREHPGGAEIDVTMLFADVRGSTALAEKLPPSEFQQIINRFYQESTDILLPTDALIDRLIGDEVVGIYVPGIAGPNHARRGVEAARELLRVTGHQDSEGAWIAVGAGIHTGVSYVGTVGSKGGAMDLTALGDVPNVAARLASLAEPGEVVISQEVLTAAELEVDSSETQRRTDTRLPSAIINARLMGMPRSSSCAAPRVVARRSETPLGRLLDPIQVPC